MLGGVCVKTSWNLPDIYLKNKLKIKLRKFKSIYETMFLKIFNSSIESIIALIKMLLSLLIKMLTSRPQLYQRKVLENVLFGVIWKFLRTTVSKFLGAPIYEICERLLLKIDNFWFLCRFKLFVVQHCLNRMVQTGNKRAAHN